MRLAIRGVVELVGPQRIGRLFRDPAGRVHIMGRVRISSGRDQHQFSAKRLQRILFFAALRVGHHDDGAIALGIPDQRQTDSRITGRPLDDHAARCEQPLRLGILDDRERRPVLDRTTGIHELALCEDFAAGGFAWSGESHQRRIADQLQGCRRNLHPSHLADKPVQRQGSLSGFGDSPRSCPRFGHL